MTTSDLIYFIDPYEYKWVNYRRPQTLESMFGIVTDFADTYIQQNKLKISKPG